MKNHLDGLIFEGMIRNGLNSLCLVEKEINDMNVFPVADGDTGTNMRRTLENGVNKAVSNKHLGLYLKELSMGMLFGARGNSGAILSQLFKGMSQELISDGIVNITEMKNALIRAYQTAYKSVFEPVEGTMLTVAREGIELIKDKIVGDMTPADEFALYVDAMKVSLEKTPEKLQLLKDAGVVDSGAAGYIALVEGMAKYLKGEVIQSGISFKPVEETSKVDTASLFNEDSAFEEGYCLEFLLQLMNSKNKEFNIDEFRNYLNTKGNSIVAIQEDKIVKVHVHTFTPAYIINKAQEFGEFISFKLENMQIQHNEQTFAKNQIPHKTMGIISVVDGDGLKELFTDLGVDVIIEGGQTMNPPMGDFLNAFKKLNADHIVIFPNNSNILLTASHAVKEAELDNVTIFPTKSVMEGYYALAMDIQDSDDIELRINSMKEGTEGISTITISTAVKPYKDDKFSCDVGEKIGCLDDELVAKGNSLVEAIDNTLSKVDGIDEKSGLIVCYGKDISDEDKEQVESMLGDKYSYLDIQTIDGGQNIYNILIGVI